MTVELIQSEDGGERPDDAVMEEFRSRFVRFARELPELSLERQLCSLREDFKRLTAATSAGEVASAVKAVGDRLEGLAQQSASRHEATLERLAQLADVSEQIRKIVDTTRRLLEPAPAGAEAEAGHDASPASRSSSVVAKGTGAAKRQSSAHAEETVPVPAYLVKQISNLDQQLEGSERRLRSLVNTVCACMRFMDEFLRRDGEQDREELTNLRGQFVSKLGNEDVFEFAPEAGADFNPKEHERAHHGQVVPGKISETLLPGYKWVTEVLVKAKVETGA